MKKVIGVILIILGIVGAIYVGGWLMFIQPIISACVAFDSGTLTGMIVGTTVLKCIFASFVAVVIFWVGVIGGIALIDD